MRYLITEMLFFLLVTAVLGIIVGWLARALLAARREREHEHAWRRELRRSDARAGNLKNQLAEAFLVEQRLRDELSQSEAVAEGSDAEKIESLEAELAGRDKKIEVLKLQITQSEAALSSEWQSLKAVKSELAGRQQRLQERGKQVSGKLRSSEETRQQLRLQLRSMKSQSNHLQEELTAAQQALTDERRATAARIAELEAKLEEQETMVALLSVENEAAPVEPAVAEPAVVEEAAATLAEESTDEEPMAEDPADEEPPDDLQQIRGIGPVLHRKLNDAGVTSFRQIAAWTDDDVKEAARRIGVGAGRIRKGGWIKAARELL